MENFKFKKKRKLLHIKKLALYIVFIIILFLIFKIGILFFNKDIKSISRNNIYKNAMTLVNYKWNYNLNKNIDETIKLPYYISSEEKEYIGIPYCYGGRISLDRGSENSINNFQNLINKGYYPGNINTSNGHVDKTIGVDCSGFVGSIFNIDEKNISTNNINKYFEEVNIKKLKPMDILNNRGKHVYVYLGKSRVNNGVIILESTSSGSENYMDKVVVNYKSLERFEKDIENGYVPLRYKNIKGDFNKSFFDEYEYNNKEELSVDINVNEIINGSIDYIEDIDYYKVNNKEDKKLTMEITNGIENVNLNIYSKKGEVINSVKGIYEIPPSEEVFIKIASKNKKNNIKYTIKVLAN